MAIGPARVVRPGLTLRRLPHADAPVAHEAPCGVEVLVLRAREEAGTLWLRLRLPDGREGWAADGDAVARLRTATIVGSSVPLLAEARAGAPVVVMLRPNAVVTVLAPSGAESIEFVPVRLPASGREGFVAGSTTVIWDRAVADPGEGPPLSMEYAPSRTQVRRAAVGLIWVGIHRVIGVLGRRRRNAAWTGPIGRIPP